MGKQVLYLFCLLFLPFSVEAATTIHVADPATWSNASLSQYIGQTVTFDCPMYISSNGGWGSNGFRIGPRRAYAPTNMALPGSTEYTDVVTLNNCATITVTGVPTDNGKIRRMGTIVTGLTVKLSSTTSGTWVSGTCATNSRQDLIQEAAKGFPDLYDHENESINVLVCAMNCEYYLVSHFGTGYGPDSESEHQKQRTKISEALAAIGADLYGFVEIQQGNGALTEIAKDLSTKTGHPYTCVNSQTSTSGSYTQSGFVYRTDNLELADSIQKVTATGNFASRLVLAHFRVKSNGGSFIYSINHYKAKSGTGTGGDADKGDGQGSYNATRTTQAKATLSKYQSVCTWWDENDVLFMGDMNAYAMEDPIQVFLKAGMTDLHRYYHADTSYSYTFGGTAGYLDHAIVNSTLLKQVKGMQAYHINSDENDDYTYDSGDDLTRFRCSDHDPVLVAMYIKPDGGTEIPELFDRLEAEYYRVYDLMGRLVSEGSEERIPGGGKPYIVVKYGRDPYDGELRKVASQTILSIPTKEQ